MAAVNYGIISALDPTALQQQPAEQISQNIEQSSFTPTVGSEFGEVDRPGRPGAYAASNWNVGKWGANLEGFDNEGVALPYSVLRNYGNYNDKGFADNFNSMYDVVVQDPNSGAQTVTGLKDAGPAGWTGAGIDLLGGTRAKLGLGENFKGALNYKIVPKGTMGDFPSLTGGAGGTPGEAPLAPWDIALQQAQNHPQTVSIGTFFQAQQDTEKGVQPSVTVNAPAAPSNLPTFSTKSGVSERDASRPEYFGLRVATDSDVAQYDQYLANGGDPNQISPYDRLAIALRKDPKFLTNPQNLGVLQELVLNPMQAQRDKESTAEHVANAVGTAARGIWGMVGDMANYLKGEVLDTVPSMRFVAAKALGLVPDQESQNAFANQAATNAQGIGQVVSDVNALVGGINVGINHLQTNIALNYTTDPAKRAELLKNYAQTVQNNARYQDQIFDLGQHLQATEAQLYSWLPGTADIEHAIATAQPDISAVRGFSDLAQFAIPEGAGALAKGAIRIFRPAMTEAVQNAIIDNSVVNNVKAAYDNATAVPTNVAEEAANPFYQAGRTAQSNLGADAQRVTQSAATSADALAQKLTSLQKISGDPGSVTNFVAGLTQKAGNAAQWLGDTSAQLAELPDAFMNKLGLGPTARAIAGKVFKTVLFGAGAHAGHAFWGKALEEGAETVGETLEHMPDVMSKLSDVLKLYGTEKLYGETTIPFWTRMSQGTKLVGPRMAAFLDSPALLSIQSMAKGTAAGTLIGMGTGALMDPDDPIQGAAEMGMMGGAFGMVGGGFQQWMRYQNPAEFYKAFRGDWKRTSDMMSPADKQSFLSLPARDQLMIGTFSQQHPGVNIKFINDEAGNLGVHTFDPVTNKPTVVINTANPQSPLRQVFAHEIMHSMQDSGMLPDVYDALLGNPERGTIGQFTALDAKGQPLGIEPTTGRYITDQDFANYKNQYVNDLARAGEPVTGFSDLDIAKEIYAEHGVDYMLSGKGFVDGTSAYRPGWINSNGLKKALASLGVAFDANGNIVQGSGLFDNLQRNDAITNVIGQYLRKRAGERTYSGEEPATRHFTKEDLRSTKAAETFLNSAPEMVRNPDGSVQRDPNTGLPVMRTPAQVKAYNAKLANDLFDRIAALPEDQRMAMGVRIQGENMFARYLPSDMIDALGKTNEYNPNQLGMLRASSEMLADNQRMGTNTRFFYHTALTENKKYSGFRGTEKFTVPYGLEITKNDNVNVKGVDFQQLNDNFVRNAKRKPYSDIWKGNVGDFVQDAHQYFQNHADGLPGASRGITEAKRDAINSLMGFGTELHREMNPIVGSVDPKVRSIIKSYRVDRTNQWTPLEKTSPFTDESQYRKMNMNYLPRRTEPPGEVQLRGAGAEEGKVEGRLRYTGAPPGVNDARSLRRLKDKLIQLANEGEAFRFWYEEGAHTMMRGVGNDPHRFERLVANIAATSPQNRVYPNEGMAVRALAQQEAGGRRITIGKGELMKKRLSEIARGEIWSGIKTNQFYRDHMAVFDQRLAEDMGSTMDMHMARAFGYPTDTFTPAQSHWAQGIMREVTQELGWDKPKHTQAAVWSAIKARFEEVWPKYREAADQAGDRIEKANGKFDFKNAATESKYRNAALKEAMKIAPPDLSEAAFNFGDAMRRDLGYVSYESRPSADIQAQHPWMQAMTPEDWDKYHHQAIAIVNNPDGTNKLANATGLLSLGEHMGYGAWGEERNLSQQVSAVMPKAGGRVLELAGQKYKIDPTVEHQIKDFAAATGLLYQQDGVGYHRPYFADENSGVTRKEANGVSLNLGRTLTKDETGRLVNNLAKRIPSYDPETSSGWYPAPDANGVKLISFGHPDGKKFYDLVEKATNDTFPGAEKVDMRHFAAYGNLQENNWKTHPNGENYSRWLVTRGRSDLLRTVTDILRPQIDSLNQEWRERKLGGAVAQKLGKRTGKTGVSEQTGEGSPELARPPPN